MPTKTPPQPLLNPTTDWTLRDWATAVIPGKGLARALAEACNSFAEALAPAPALSKDLIHSWLQRSRRVPDQPEAVSLVAALALLAQRQGSPLFRGANLRVHGELFMLSHACAHKFASPTEEQYNAIERVLHKHQPTTGLSTTVPVAAHPLLRYVQPPPPHYPLGREGDIARVLALLHANPAVLLAALPGFGKTALAWFVALAAVAQERFSNFDWNSDKRSITLPIGQTLQLAPRRLNLDVVLRSMVQRFGWRDAEGLEGDRLVSHCARHLREGHYLIVLDNLETVSNADDIVRQLIDMMRRHHQHDFRSRLLITSQVALGVAGCVAYEVDGLPEASWPEMVRLIEHQMRRVPVPLTDEQCVVLGRAFHGNPLLLQAAVIRYHQQPGDEAFAVLTATQADPFARLTTDIFQPLFDRLPEPVRYLACYAAKALAHVFEADLRDYWQDSGGDADEFAGALQALCDVRFLERLPPNDEADYAMHSLVRRFLAEQCGPAVDEAPGAESPPP